MQRHHTVLTLLILLGLAGGAGQAGASDSVDVENGNVNTYRQGWYLSFGLAGTKLDLEAGRQEVTALKVEEEGGGLEFGAGYAFDERFALQARLVASVHKTEREDVDAYLAQFQLDAVTHFRAGHRFQPFVAGGVGGAAFGVEGSDIENRSISGGAIDFGGGLEYHLSPHFALTLDHRQSIQRFDNKRIEVDGATTTLDIESSGHTATTTLRIDYSF